MGIESTVLDLTGQPRILRPGGIGREMIESVLGEHVVQASEVAIADQAMMSPGQLPIHYAPVAPAYRFDPEQRLVVAAWAADRPNVVILPVQEQTPAEYARRLYANLREADSRAEVILIEMPPDQPVWTAVRDRLLRATQPWKLSDSSHFPSMIFFPLRSYSS